MPHPQDKAPSLNTVQSQRTNPPFTGVPLRSTHVIVLALLLVAPGMAIARLFAADRAWMLAGWVVLASVITYALYAWDKRRAQQGQWRIPEKVLHLWELLGGWPGGFLAQQHLRHKSAKLSYLVKFWLIVALHHYLAIDAQLNWRLFHDARAWIASLL